MAGKKVSHEDISGNTEVIADLLASPVLSSKKTETEFVEEEKGDKVVHLTMLVKESTRKAWKKFFLDHDLNTTQGIEIAMLHIIDDVNNGKFKLNKGGLSKVEED